jgi:NADPH:quinone reductase-like Zn-dependent oxidoreductase
MREPGCKTYFSYASVRSVAEDLGALGRLADGSVHAHVARTATLDDVSEAIDDLDQRRVHGKVVVLTR